jgi:hypothetical protein
MSKRIEAREWPEVLNMKPGFLIDFSVEKMKLTSRFPFVYQGPERQSRIGGLHEITAKIFIEIST